MGTMQRNKGKRGQREFAEILHARGWEVMESAGGTTAEDFLGVSPDKIIFAIEVKHHKKIDLERFIKQAKEQAARRKQAEWLLACRLDGFPMTFLVLSSVGEKTVWNIEN